VTSKPKNYRELEKSIHTDLKDRMSYSDYLHLDLVLDAQHPLSDQHDEMLFIIIHQASEIWLKLAGHEVEDELGPASGFQSYAYRKLEFLLGNKNRNLVEVHRHDTAVYEELKRVLDAPSLYDVVLRRLSGDGLEINPAKLDRDFSLPYEADETVQAAWFEIYRNPDSYFELYELAEKLVDIEDSFQAWRFKHMYTVQRIIGNRRGTGGSSGVPFLKKAIETSFFPELFAIRTDL